MIFDIENWLWKSNFGIFWHLPATTICKTQKFPLGLLILRQKSFQICTPAWKINNLYYHKWIVCAWVIIRLQKIIIPYIPFMQIFTYILMMSPSRTGSSQSSSWRIFSSARLVAISLQLGKKFQLENWKILLFSENFSIFSSNCSK